MNKRLFTWFCAAVFASVLLIPAAPRAEGAFEDFSDITGHWSQSAMQTAYSNGLIEGYNSKLNPDGVITQAQMLTIICRALGATQEADASALNIPTDAWYGSAVAKALYLGIIDLKDSAFDSPVTRGDAFAMILRAFQLEPAFVDTSVLDKYNDTFTYQTKLRKTMAAAVLAGLAEGYGGNLSAARPVTRAEFITILSRAASYYGQAGELSAGPAVGSVLRGDAAFDNIRFDKNVLLACDAGSVDLSRLSAQNLIIRSNNLEKLSVNNGSNINRLILAGREGDVVLVPEDSYIDTLVVGFGHGSVTAGEGVGFLEVTGSGREITVTQAIGGIEISGNDNTIYIDDSVEIPSVLVGGAGNRLLINGTVKTLRLAGEGTVLSGSGSVQDALIYDPGFDCENPGVNIKTADYDPGIREIDLRVNAPDKLPLMQTLRVTAELEEAFTHPCEGRWFIDGEAAGAVILRPGDTTAEIFKEYQYWKDMPESSHISFSLRYITDYGEAQFITADARVKIENYSEQYYFERDVERILELVVPVYSGDYTLQYALNHDYQDYEKEIWVSKKGYASDTQYLVWVNLAYQRVNIFEGVAGDWKLIRSGLVGTGAPGSGTPVGVWKTTYKQEAGWTTGTYTVRPVVRFKGGGYAFHSRLYYPGTWTLNDDRIGFPISHGCVRMLQEDIQWMFDNLPEGTTVVVY